MLAARTRIMIMAPENNRPVHRKRKRGPQKQNLKRMSSDVREELKLSDLGSYYNSHVDERELEDSDSGTSASSSESDCGEDAISMTEDFKV